jgi:small GTP-binding protein
MKHSSSSSYQYNEKVEESSMACFKVVLLGDAGTGKSSLASRFVKNEFLPYSESTLGVSYSSKTFDIPYKNIPKTKAEPDDWIFYCSRNSGVQEVDDVKGQSCRVTFKIWDTAGQERFSNLAAMYYRGASIGILVYDICNPTSFEALQRWVNEIIDDDSVSSSPEKMKPSITSRPGQSHDIILAIVGNKCDLNCDRRISKSVAENFARKVNAFYVETSARENIMIEELFVEMGSRALDKWLATRTRDTSDDETIRLEYKRMSTSSASSSCCRIS